MRWKISFASLFGGGRARIFRRAGPGRRRLFVDLSILRCKDAGTGIQRVVRHVWHELVGRNLRDFEIVPVYAMPDGLFYHGDMSECGNAGQTAAIVVASPGDIFLGLDFSPILLPRAKKTLRLWRRSGIGIHILVYDLLPSTHPQWFTRRGASNHRRWLATLAECADGLICISNTVARDLRAWAVAKRWPRVDEIRIGTMRLGATFRHGLDKPPIVPPALEAFADREIILMVGTVEPRKDYDFALEVLTLFWSSRDDRSIVVIVGKPGWKTGRIQARLREHPLAGQRLFWLNDADDQQLAWLYANSTVLLSTTRAEGFGLPIAEALSSGLPVIAPDLVVFREFGGSGVTFFPVGDVRAAVACLTAAVEAAQKGCDDFHWEGANWADATQDILGFVGVTGEVQDGAAVI